MTAIIFPQRWRKPPQVPIEANPNHWAITGGGFVFAPTGNSSMSGADAARTPFELSQTNAAFSGARFHPELGIRLWADHGGNADDRLRCAKEVVSGENTPLTQLLAFTPLAYSSAVSHRIWYGAGAGESGHFLELTVSTGGVISGYRGGNGFEYYGTHEKTYTNGKTHVAAIASRIDQLEVNFDGDTTWASGVTGAEGNVADPNGTTNATAQPTIGALDYTNYYHFNGWIALWIYAPYVYADSGGLKELVDAPYSVLRPLRRRLYFAPAAGGGDQTITASAITSVEAFGTTRLDLELALSGIASLEAFGTAQLDLNIATSGIATAEAFGTASLDHIVGATGIATAEAFGTAQLDLQIDLSGIASLEAFGSHSVNLDTEQSITAAGAIATAEAFGTARLDFNLLASSTASAEAFGTARLDLNIAANSVATGEAFGSHEVALDASQSITDAGDIATAEAFGTAQLDLELLMAAIATAEAFGSATVTGGASTFVLTGRTFRDEGGRTFRAPPKGRTIH